MGVSWNWAFGICDDYWKENRDDKIDDEEGLFLLGYVKEGTHSTLSTNSPLVLQYVPRPIGRIGVFLDCEGRTESFINIAQSSLIYRVFLPVPSLPISSLSFAVDILLTRHT